VANLLSQNEVDVLMKAISSGQLAEQPEPAAARKAVSVPASQRAIKLYDFKHPVMFLKDQLRTLQMIHESFARTLSNSLSSTLRTIVNLKCIGVDQVSYGEFAMSLPDPCTLVNLRMRPSEGRVLMAIHPAVSLGIVDRVTGGTGISETAARPLTEIEQAIIDEVVVVVLRDLETSWSRIMKFSFSSEGIEYSAQFAQVTTEEDTVVATTLEVTFAETHGMLSLCYPFRTLNPVMEKLSAKHWIAEEQKAQAAKSHDNIQACVAQIPLRLSAHLGKTMITVQELLDLKQNDVLLMNREIMQMVDLEAGGKPRFRGHLGISHGKVALLIEERVSRE